MQLKRLTFWLITFSAAYPLCAQQVVGWRTDGTGLYPNATPPTQWSKDTKILWSTRMPGPSNASPIVVRDRVFVCSEPSELLCVSAKDGKILWQRSNTYLDTLDPATAEKVKADTPEVERINRELTSLDQQLKQQQRVLKETPDNASAKQKSEELTRQASELKPKLKNLVGYVMPVTHPTNGYSSATPASNAKQVFAVFGNGVVACYDLTGNRKWFKFLEAPKHGWGHSASPLLVGDKLLVFVNDLVALNVTNGEIAWRAAVAHHWGSPIHARIDKTDVAITAGGEIVRVADGALLAKGLAGLDYCAPILQNGIAYFIQNGGKAVRLPAQVGDTIFPETLWSTTPKADRYYASPACHDGLLYATTQQGDFSVIDAQNGQVVYEKRLNLGGTAYPSVTLAGKLLYVMGDSGTTLVLQPGREYVEVARNTFEGFRCSPVFIGKRMYVRGFENLYCIGE